MILEVQVGVKYIKYTTKFLNNKIKMSLIKILFIFKKIIIFF